MVFTKHRLQRVRAWAQRAIDKGLALEQAILHSKPDQLQPEELVALIDAAQETWREKAPQEVTWTRLRFYSPGIDPRPMTVPAPGPWWCSGTTGDGRACIIVAYVPLSQDAAKERVAQKDLWPGAYDITGSGGEVGPPTFTDRFPKPAGWDEKSACWTEAELALCAKIMARRKKRGLMCLTA